MCEQFFFFYLTISGPRRSIALSVIYCVTVVPRHTPNSSHLVAMATGHRTLKDKITHIHTHAQTQEERSPVNRKLSQTLSKYVKVDILDGASVKVQLSGAWVRLSHACIRRHTWTHACTYTPKVSTRPFTQFLTHIRGDPTVFRYTRAEEVPQDRFI